MCVCTFAVNYMLAKVNTWSRLAVNSILVVHVYRIYMNMALYRNSHIKGLIFLSRVYITTESKHIRSADKETDLMAGRGGNSLISRREIPLACFWTGTL